MSENLSIEQKYEALVKDHDTFKKAYVAMDQDIQRIITERDTAMRRAEDQRKAMLDLNARITTLEREQEQYTRLNKGIAEQRDRMHSQLLEAQAVSKTTTRVLSGIILTAIREGVRYDPSDE